VVKLAGQKVVVIGLARSGLASIRLLLADRAHVTVNDKRGEAALLPEECVFLAQHPEVQFVGGGHPSGLVDGKTALVIKNPGVPPGLPPLKEAARLGVPVITEVEYAFWKMKAMLVAVTGTNGKTTTTALTGEIYKAAGRKTFTAGNIGFPLTAVVQEAGEDDVIVAELSSFQLEGTLTFRPHLCAILNLTPDHLDRHGSFAAYAAAKARIFANQREDNAVVLNADDPQTKKLAGRSASRIYFFSRKEEVERGAFLRGGFIVLRDGEREEEICRAQNVAIPGAHNLENALAAALLAWLGGVEAEVIAGVLRSFPGVPHRLEFVRTIKGVDYINDSKGTNPDATIKALEAIQKKVILIAGGYEKGADFTPLVKAMQGKVGHAVLIGQVAERLGRALAGAGFDAYTFAKTLEEAVAMAANMARPGDVVLLSPACASWDMFRDFEERGEVFKKAVRSLEGQINGR
jgi:UDP-N-acetylmuramoylalanine--D-glutamate ligase